jgi:signal transduction histidine kinase
VPFQDGGPWASFVHDLREPVFALDSALRMLRREVGYSVPERARVLLDLSLRAVVDLREIVANAPRGTSLQEMRLRTVATQPLAEEIAAVLAVVAREHEASIAVDPLPAVRAHEAGLRRVLQNLVANAVRHGGARPRVRVWAHEEPEGPCLVVEDDGPGIPADDLPRLILGAPAWPDKHAPHGLRSAAELTFAMGGSLHVRAAPAGGASVHVRLQPPMEDE